MKLETKIKRIEKKLIKNNGFSLEEAKSAIKETLYFVKLENVSCGYFERFLINTYNIEGVER